MFLVCSFVTNKKVSGEVIKKENKRYFIAINNSRKLYFRSIYLFFPSKSRMTNEEKSSREEFILIWFYGIITTNSVLNISAEKEQGFILIIRG